MKTGLSVPAADVAGFSGANTGSASYLAWFALIAYLALDKIVITFVPACFRMAAQATVFGWQRCSNTSQAEPSRALNDVSSS